MATKSDQLTACAIWNAAEADRAYAASLQEKNGAERLYLARRANRLSDQAESLYDQSRAAWRKEMEAAVAGWDCTNNHVAA